MENNNLLDPSLSDNDDLKTGLSIRSQVLVALFGGIMTSLFFHIFQSTLLGRLKKDLLFHVLSILGFVSLLFFLPNLLKEMGIDPKLIRLIGRVLGLAALGLFYLRISEEQKYIESFDRKVSPWKYVGYSILLGFALSFLFIFVSSKI